MTITAADIVQWEDTLEAHEKDTEGDTAREVDLANFLSAAIAEITRLRPDLDQQATDLTIAQTVPSLGNDTVKWAISYDRDEIELKLDEAGVQAPTTSSGWAALMERLQTAVDNCTAGTSIEDAMGGVIDTLPPTHETGAD